jgi:hypothetical protein
LFDVNRMRSLSTPLSKRHDRTASIVSSLGANISRTSPADQGKAQRKVCAGIMYVLHRPTCRDVGALLMEGVRRERGFCSGEETETKDDE